MMSLPVLKSKLIMPELSESFLLTDRLRSLHQMMASSRGVTVCAPAGYGKTSLAVSYFSSRGAAPFRVCWYRLDPEDKNLSVFLAHLSEALLPSRPQQTIADICRELWRLYDGEDSQGSPLEDKEGKPHTYLVLDDFHNVAQNEEICDGVRYLLDNLPPSSTIFVLNRASQNIFSEKQKLEKKILRIDAGDLSFSNGEIEKLLGRIGHSAHEEKLIELIKKNTEGWIAGVLILYHALKDKRPDAAALEGGGLVQEEALFRYLSMEVLKSVERDIQDALARLALLQDFSEAEASEILEIQDIKSLMGQCMGFGMFIQSIPGEPVVYRFHSLFREFLLSILKDRYPEEQISRLHLKAVGYYMGRGTYGRAAEHLVQCGNSSSAMDMVSQKGFNKFMIGETAQLKQWLDLLPEETIRDNPVLLLFKAQLLPNSRQPELVDALREVAGLSLESNDLATYYDAASVLIYILMCCNNMQGLVEMTEGLSQRRRYASAELDNTLIILDMVRSIGEERFSQAEAQSESTVYALLPEDSQWLYLILSCIVYFCLGKLDKGERCMEIALELEKFKKIEPSRGFILMFLSMVLSLKNEREHLPSYTSEVRAIGEKYSYEYLSGHGSRLEAIDRYLSFQTEAACERMEQAAFFFLRTGNRAMAVVCKLLRRLWITEPAGHMTDLEELKRDLEVIAQARPGMLLRENALSILGAIAREAGDFALAEDSLIAAMELSREKQGWQMLCGVLFHMARLYFDIGDGLRGRRCLKEALELASGNRYFMFWDIHLPTLVEMTLRGIKYGYCPGYSQELLGRFYGDKTAKYLGEKIKNMDESRTKAFADEFVAANQGGQSKPLYLIKASLLGRPEILVNGIPIPDSEWKTKKVKSLFEYLLLRSGTTVAKETLAELLWPEADSRSATASLRTALYHLRKALAKYQVETTGENALIRETAEGLQIRRDSALELDVHDFLRLYEEWALLGKQGLQPGPRPSDNGDEKREEILKEMIRIYRGDLMEGNDLGDPVFHEQERLKSIFVEACRELSGILTRTGALQQAEEVLRRAFAADPFDEAICLGLLELYMSQGRKNKAVKLYYSFKKRLEQELDVKIDKRLTEAIREPGR